MSEIEGFGGLVNYYTEFVPKHLPLPGGKPRGRRSAQKIAKEFGLRLVRVKKLTFIDPVEAAEDLRAYAAQRQREPHPGRPPKIAA